MPARRAKTAGNVQNKQLSVEMRRSRLAFFIQQFEKEAQERMNDLEAKLENLLSTVDRAFKVELLKMPPSLQNTLIGDLISEEDVSVSNFLTSIAMRSESLEMVHPLRRIPRKKIKSNDSPPVTALRASSKTLKIGKATTATRSLDGSNVPGNPTSTSTKRTLSRLTNRKTPEQMMANQRTPKLRSVVSAGELHCSTAGATAHIAVTTAQGRVVSFSEETKDVDFDLLDDVARCQIQKLSRLMEYLSQQSRCQH